MTPSPNKTEEAEQKGVGLLPCPFCGGKAEQPFFGEAVQCAGCHGYAPSPEIWNCRSTLMPSTADVDDAVAAWHAGAGANVGLPEFLGWSLAEYAAWVGDENVIPQRALSLALGESGK